MKKKRNKGPSKQSDIHAVPPLSFIIEEKRLKQVQL